MIAIPNVSSHKRIQNIKFIFLKHLENATKNTRGRKTSLNEDSRGTNVHTTFSIETAHNQMWKQKKMRENSSASGNVAAKQEISYCKPIGLLVYVHVPEH